MYNITSAIVGGGIYTVCTRIDLHLPHYVTTTRILLVVDTICRKDYPIRTQYHGIGSIIAHVVCRPAYGDMFKYMCAECTCVRFVWNTVPYDNLYIYININDLINI